MEERPPPDPAKLLAAWMDWERGGVMPGQTLANLKREGMRELLEATLAVREEALGATPEA